MDLLGAGTGGAGRAQAQVTQPFQGAGGLPGKGQSLGPSGLCQFGVVGIRRTAVLLGGQKPRSNNRN